MRSFLFPLGLAIAAAVLLSGFAGAISPKVNAPGIGPSFSYLPLSPLRAFVVRVFKASTEDRGLFGNNSVVSEWVKLTRETVRTELKALLANQDLVIGSRLSPALEVPMEGFGFKIPESIADLTMRQFIESHLADPDDNPVTPSPESLLSIRAELMEGMSVEEFVNSSLTILPTSFNFFDRYSTCKMTNPFMQGDCGSCWAWAAGGTLRHRLCKKMVDAGWDVPKDWMLSIQDLISCASREVSPSGNSCRSGRTSVAADFIAGRATPDDECVPLMSLGLDPYVNLCGTGNDCPAKFGPHGRNRVSYLHFLQHENRVREFAIMRSIMNNGPVIMTFNVPSEFTGYRGQGVLRLLPNDTYISRTRNTGEVIHSVHAVGVVGWGELNGEKYWLAQNSWGPRHTAFGNTPWEQGFFRIARGDDACRIESIGVMAITPELPSSNPFCPAGASPCRPTERKVTVPTALAPCEGEFAQGWCVAPDGSGCGGNMFIANPSRLKCAAPLICCQAAPTIPQTPCEAIMDGALCGPPGECVAGQRSIVPGSLCPRLRDVCCAPTWFPPLLPSTNNDGSRFDMSLVSARDGAGVNPFAVVNSTAEAPDQPDEAAASANGTSNVHVNREGWANAIDRNAQKFRNNERMAIVALRMRREGFFKRVSKHLNASSYELETASNAQGAGPLDLENKEYRLNPNDPNNRYKLAGKLDLGTSGAERRFSAEQDAAAQRYWNSTDFSTGGAATSDNANGNGKNTNGNNANNMNRETDERNRNTAESDARNRENSSNGNNSNNRNSNSGNNGNNRNTDTTVNNQNNDAPMIRK